jgi:mono/diheme cytochrome c family protein
MGQRRLSARSTLLAALVGAQGGVPGGGADDAAARSAKATFHETIEPLFQRHCQECHRKGGGAPFSLESYDDAAGWAATIEEVVTTRRMPPWHADRSIGTFANDRSLDDATIAAIAGWARSGAPEGDPVKAPLPRTWPTSWALPEPPDLLLTTPGFAVPAEGTLPYQYVRVATGLTEARFVRAAEVRSNDPQVVHHVLVFLEEPKGAPAATESGTPIERPWRPVFNQFELLQGAAPHERPKWIERFKKLIAHDLRFGEAGGLNGYLFSGLAGGGAATFGPDEGKYLPAGSTLLFQIHHQPNGRPTESTTTIALWFADGPRRHALDTRGVSTVVFEIPPGATDHEVRAEYRLPAAATLRSLQPHLHRRGKDFAYFARLPDDPDGAPGAEEELLRVPRFDFDWQEEYVLAEPKRLPAGTVLRVVAHFDNSAANPKNPDPAQTVWFGLQTHEEMMIGYFEAIWDPSELAE